LLGFIFRVRHLAPIFRDAICLLPWLSDRSKQRLGTEDSDQAAKCCCIESCYRAIHGGETMPGDEMGAWHAAFARQRYVILESVLTDPILTVAYQYLMKRVLLGRETMGDGAEAGARSFYADPLMETLLELVQSVATAFSGLDLWPTFSWARFYPRGASFGPRVGRPACEVTLSLPLGYRAAKIWPLHVGTPEGVQTALLARGDAILLRGCECPQWRGELAGDYHCQASFHFVDRRGPHAEWRFDKRPALGRPALGATGEFPP
jgi:hypothetical protein